MQIGLYAVVVLILGAFSLADSTAAQNDQGSAPMPETVAPPGIIVMPPRLPQSVPVFGDQQQQTCPATDRKLELIG